MSFSDLFTGNKRSNPRKIVPKDHPNNKKLSQKEKDELEYKLWERAEEYEDHEDD